MKPEFQPRRSPLSAHKHAVSFDCARLEALEAVADKHTRATVAGSRGLLLHDWLVELNKQRAARAHPLDLRAHRDERSDLQPLLERCEPATRPDRLLRRPPRGRARARALQPESAQE
jgi:hypothetical protein